MMAQKYVYKLIKTANLKQRRRGEEDSDTVSFKVEAKEVIKVSYESPRLCAELEGILENIPALKV